MAEDLSLFQEIDEALRVERLQHFWQRFGNVVIAGCVGIVLATTGWVLWKNHTHEEEMKATSVLLHAQTLASEGKPDEADKLLEGEDSRLAAFAQLLRAQMLMNANHADKAREVYKQAAGYTHSDAALQDFAALQAGVAGDDAALTHASASGRPYALVAQEIQAARLLKDGKRKEADALLEAIASDRTAPGSQRERVTELLGTFGEDAK